MSEGVRQGPVDFFPGALLWFRDCGWYEWHVNKAPLQAWLTDEHGLCDDTLSRALRNSVSVFGLRRSCVGWLLSPLQQASPSVISQGLFSYS